MLLHNTTFSVDATVDRAWLDWVQEIYFTAAKETGYVQQCKLMRMRNVPEDSGLTYSAQLYFIQESHWVDFSDEIEPMLFHHLAKQFDSKVLYFQSQLDILI